MTELTFSAVILTGNQPKGRKEQEVVALQRALELFNDAGVDDILIAGGRGDRMESQDYPLRHVPAGKGAGENIGSAAAMMRGTHLMVLDAGFSRMEPIFFLRLMQMSCLGMGVLPFVKGIAQPLVACYPAGVRAVPGVSGEDGSVEGNWAAKILAKGLVARYDVPSAENILFTQSDVAISADYFSSR